MTPIWVYDDDAKRLEEFAEKCDISVSDLVSILSEDMVLDYITTEAKLSGNPLFPD